MALKEVAFVFARLGLIGFGGPAAHIALMRTDVVDRRKWIDDQEFLDLVGVTALLPGPNSTELSMLIGRRRAGRLGLVVGGVSFIAPAVIVVGTLAWLYVRYGTTPAGEDLLWALKAVMVAIVAGAVVGLARTAVKGPRTAFVAVAVVPLYLLGWNELALLAAGALVLVGLRGAHGFVFLGAVGGTAATAASTDLWRLAAAFLKVGALLFGSGYVLLAYLRTDLVEGLKWITEQQLIDAVAVGQMTPGPVFSTATFVGYLVHGWGGAVVATVAIFLPSFILVALTATIIPRIRDHAWAANALDGVNAAAVGLLVGITVEIARTAFVDAWAVVVAIVAGLVVVSRRVHPTVLVVAGLLVGLLRSVLS